MNLLSNCFPDYCMVCERQCSPGCAYCSDDCRKKEQYQSTTAIPSHQNSLLPSLLPSASFSRGPQASLNSQLDTVSVSSQAHCYMQDTNTALEQYPPLYEIPTLGHSASFSSSTCTTASSNSTLSLLLEYEEEENADEEEDEEFGLSSFIELNPNFQFVDTTISTTYGRHKTFNTSIQARYGFDKKTKPIVSLEGQRRHSSPETPLNPIQTQYSIIRGRTNSTSSETYQKWLTMVL